MSDPVERCHCGLPLHYTDPEIRAAVESLIALLGAEIPVVNAEGRTFLVPRHYIALHGIKEQEVGTLGFREVTTDVYNDVFLVAGAARAMAEQLRRFMKVRAIEPEQGDQRRLVITFASGARVRIIVEGVE